MFVFFLMILLVHADALCRVSEGVVQCRDWREFETGNHLMANFVILERVGGEINVQEYPVLSRLLVHDPQTKCDAIKPNTWTTIQIGSHTCQNGQQSSWVTEKITSTTLRTMEMTAIAFKKPWIYAILGGISVVVVIFSLMIVCAIKRKCLRRRVDIEIESQSLTEFDAVVMRDFKNHLLFSDVSTGTVCEESKSQQCTSPSATPHTSTSHASSSTRTAPSLNQPEAPTQQTNLLIPYLICSTCIPPFVLNDKLFNMLAPLIFFMH
ncbi:uncharacterized protein LOC133180109 [Saccostrea echinata]|uniref:uncharacterized protein LOC133180109 n=1 Tax=Saccostrea echinata TaxID=191078 RepID=UPI002A7EEEFF|nr:uncharacterized protein LOC133180109 [Saccostrea echinata]